MDMREIKFRACKEFPDLYRVSDVGIVFGQKGRALKPFYDRDGYKKVTLVVKGKHFPRKVHRLVAEAFLKQPSPKHQVNHKNGDRVDNRLENLEWVTSRENTLHGWRVNGRKQSLKQIETRSRLSRGENNPEAKLTKDQVAGIRQMRKDGFSLKEIASNYQISVAQVSAIANNKFWV